MKIHELRALRAGESIGKFDQLAWKLAELASCPAPIDPEVSSAVTDRIVDSIGVAIAALNNRAVAAARAPALAHPAVGGATVLGMPRDIRVACEWAAWANGTAIRELDFHDNYYGANVCHPADAIAPLVAVAQQSCRDGATLLRAIALAYEVQVALARSVPLAEHGMDHTANLAPAVAVGLGALLGLRTETIFEAVNHAVHVSFSTLQGRRGRITGWKANAPAHVGKLAIEAVDRAMRGEQGPNPIYEGDRGIVACMLGGLDSRFQIALPERGEPWRAILETFTKEHATGYHAQAFIDLAFRLRERIDDIESIDCVEIRTKAYTHLYVGSGSEDPEKMNPKATRESLDHSVMFAFAAALLDGEWDPHRTFLPERVQRGELVRLWHKVRTVADDGWTLRFRERTGLEKDHGGEVIVSFTDGRKLAEQIDVPDAHPRGLRPFSRADYIRKFDRLVAGRADQDERTRFLETADRLPELDADGVRCLTITAAPSVFAGDHQSAGIFEAGLEAAQAAAIHS